MTASMEQSVRKPSGFTIDSLIGKDSSDRSETPHQRQVKESLSLPESTDVHRKDRLKILSRDRRDVPSSSHEQRKELPPFSSLHDSRRLHSDFSPVRRERDSETFSGLHSASESLKHLHDVLSQTSGGTGTYFPPRVCRHPLSSINLHSMYQSQFPQTTPLHPLVLNSSRDIRSLHPWMADRYPGYFYPRYPAPGFLFQPYRKPKRIRTAFSPSQLLQLEKAFEKSHYVVGQERKDLAAELQLTETQVKVWFQNRRTKHKRIKSEDGDDPSQDNGGSKYTGSDVEGKDSDSDISDIDDICDNDPISLMQHTSPS
ncbi:hypothetical protein FSP39_018358 [Pinctada imbricata]|uniref:Homeobox domain-containing protein n=1 Tax=Pinctada imbricata TaxID=66713 RepID=A0AA88YFK9_PINIB|nr:hypothetical protein FSP39_018358 [Pinctada imbricata]